MCLFCVFVRSVSFWKPRLDITYFHLLISVLSFRCATWYLSYLIVQWLIWLAEEDHVSPPFWNWDISKPFIPRLILWYFWSISNKKGLKSVYNCNKVHKCRWRHSNRFDNGILLLWFVKQSSETEEKTLVTRLDWWESGHFCLNLMVYNVKIGEEYCIDI